MRLDDEMRNALGDGVDDDVGKVACDLAVAASHRFSKLQPGHFSA